MMPYDFLQMITLLNLLERCESICSSDASSLDANSKIAKGNAVSQRSTLPTGCSVCIGYWLALYLHGVHRLLTVRGAVVASACDR